MLDRYPPLICPFRLTCTTWLKAADEVIVKFGVTYVARGAAGEPNSAAVLGRLPALQHLTMRGVGGGGEGTIASVLNLSHTNLWERLRSLHLSRCPGLEGL